MDAYVNHDRWVADCDTPYCGEAQEVWARFFIPDTPDNVTGRWVRYRRMEFVCGNCGKTYLIGWPADKDLIDAALSRRVVPETRNWLPGETVEELEAENTAHEHEGVVV